MCLYINIDIKYTKINNIAYGLNYSSNLMCENNNTKMKKWLNKVFYLYTLHCLGSSKITN